MVFTYREIKSTRKDFWCEGCRAFFPKGSPSVYTSGVFEGYFFALRVCVACKEARIALYERGEED